MPWGMKRPFVFNSTIGVTVVELAVWDYDSIFVANDSATDIFYSLGDQNGPFQKIRPAEIHVFDKCTQASRFYAYASAAAAALRVTLWRQTDL